MPRTGAKAKSPDEIMDGLVKARLFKKRKALYTVAEVAHGIGKTRKTIYNWIARGWLVTNEDGLITDDSLKLKVSGKDSA
jgi:hypothetical protein